MPRLRPTALTAALLPLLAVAGGAHAQAIADVFSPQTVSGALDMRYSEGDGSERGWLSGDFGKTRYGRGATLDVANADLMWKPRFLWDLAGTVDVEYQPDQPQTLGIGEAYLTYKPVPRSDWRYQVRAGMMYPPISEEHAGADWHVERTITPSAINSWIGQEIKVKGAEVKITRTFDGSDASLTSGLFSHNDTSGTELSLRGWTLDDVRTTANGYLPLPPLSNFMITKQAPKTSINYELDGNNGFYDRLDFRAGKLGLNATYYDTEGNLIAVQNKQWSWNTWFTNLGLDWQPTASTQVLAQAIDGRTQMGFRTPRIWIDADYKSAYLLVSQTLNAKDMVTGRFDSFTVHDRTFRTIDNNAEDGWAATLAWKRVLTPHASLLVEMMQVDSKRPSRALEGLPAKQTQTQVQTSLRLGF